MRTIPSNPGGGAGDQEGGRVRSRPLLRNGALIGDSPRRLLPGRFRPDRRRERRVHVYVESRSGSWPALPRSNAAGPWRTPASSCASTSLRTAAQGRADAAAARGPGPGPKSVGTDSPSRSSEPVRLRPAPSWSSARRSQGPDGDAAQVLHLERDLHSRPERLRDGAAPASTMLPAGSGWGSARPMDHSDSSGWPEIGSSSPSPAPRGRPRACACEATRIPGLAHRAEHESPGGAVCPPTHVGQREST